MQFENFEYGVIRIIDKLNYRIKFLKVVAFLLTIIAAGSLTLYFKTSLAYLDELEKMRVKTVNYEIVK